jgi:tetratricopeptide (TPR) repeat protein
MKKTKFVLAAAALLIAGTVSAQSLTDVNTKFGEAAAAMGAKDFNKAIPLFEQVIAEGMDIEGAESLVAGAKQNLPVAIFQTGGAAFQGGNLDQALAAFSRAADLAELYGNVQVLNNARTWIGRTVLKQGADAFNNKDYATAAAIFQKGYEGNPNDTDVAMNLAMSYIGMGDFAKGNEVYRAVMALGDQDSRFAEVAVKAKQRFSEDNIVRATEAAQASDYAGAVSITDEIIATLPDDALAHMTRLQAYNILKDYAKMIESGDAAIAAQTADEGRSLANFLVGAAYQNIENAAKAIEYYRQVTVGGNVAAAKAQITELQKVLK